MSAFLHCMHNRNSILNNSEQLSPVNYTTCRTNLHFQFKYSKFRYSETIQSEKNLYPFRVGHTLLSLDQSHNNATLTMQIPICGWWKPVKWHTTSLPHCPTKCHQDSTVKGRESGPSTPYSML